MDRDWGGGPSPWWRRHCSSAPFRVLLRCGDAGSWLLAVAIGCLAPDYAWDDLLGRGLLIRQLHSQILEETFELLGALALWASTMVSL